MPTSHFQAVIFDLDGVITKTALIHSAAWKKMFDDYLRERERTHGEPFREFSHEKDYLTYVDGKPRYKGVQSFLESRGIKIPYGDPSDPPEKETICGIGNRKNIAFNKILEENGVETYAGTLRLIHELRLKGIRIGVASSSKNCKAVLEAAGLLGLMETRVDGIVSEELKLHGKPEPDIFTTAADNLECTYDKTVVVEDAVSGVQAGKAGNFGLVIGVAREDNAHDLLINGADIVVNDLEEVSYDSITRWFNNGLPGDNWTLSYHDFVPGKEKTREALLAVGNGYFGTRGAWEESTAGKDHYPGTYIAGVYNRLVSKAGGREVENEDLVNCINWLPVQFRINDGPWLDDTNIRIRQTKRVLHLDNGVLWRRMIFSDDKGQETLVESKRVASMATPHLAAMSYSITPLNYNGIITVRSGLSGYHINAGVERYSQLNQQHLKPLVEGGSGNEAFLMVSTTTSDIRIAAFCRHSLVDKSKIQAEFRNESPEGRSFSLSDYTAVKGETVTLHKVVAMATSNDPDTEDPLPKAKEYLGDLIHFEDIQDPSEKAWEEIWDRIDVRIIGDRLAQKLIRLHLYHLMVTLSPHNAFIDAGVPARGLYGEAYRGHIFWDELFILPLYDIHFPEAARSVLMYRYHRLDAARAYAKDHGYLGAMFPWQSGSDGREETQVVHLNPLSGEWGPDHSSLQRHVSLAIAYNIWQYFHITGDMEFMEDYGAEMFFEICRFWVSKSHFDEQNQRYTIDKVMGPDEFHEKYPDSNEGGLRDNAYTNIMVAWCLERAFDLMKMLDGKKKEKLMKKISLMEEETGKWGKVMHGLRLIISGEGIIAQYDGYFGLKELDWDAYREKYRNIYRMDRLLKAEGKSPDEYKVAKQADTLMTFYNLSREAVDKIMDDLDYSLPGDYLRKNLEYYLARTSHGSTLSRVVHARLANMIGDTALGWELYLDALTSDYQDIQGGTTAEGIHAGVMAGTVWIALTTFAGLDLAGEHPAFNPRLPDRWRKVCFRFYFRDDDYECEVTRDGLKIRIDAEGKENLRVTWQGTDHDIPTGQWTEVN